MEACYVVFHGEAVVVNAKEQTRREIESIINELKEMCTFAPMRRKLKSWEIMRVIFPEVLADYFEIVDVTESDTSVDIFMDEREFMEREDYKLGTVRSYGFTEERVIQDFPIRGKASYLHVRRRKWRDSSTGEIFSYSYDDLTAEGSKLSPEFVAFLKE